MSAPLGPENINLGGWPFLNSAHDHGDTSIAQAPGLDLDTVKNAFAEKFVGAQGSGVSVFTRSTGPLAQVWSSLRRQPGVTMGHAIIEVVANRLLGTFIPFGSTEDAILAIKKTAILGDLVEAFTGVEDGDYDDLGTAWNTWTNNVKNTWNRIWDGAFGTTGSTGKTLSDVQTAAGAITSAANTASTNASSALSQLGSLITGLSGATIGDVVAAITSKASQLNFQTLLNNLKDGASGTTGSTGVTLSSVLAALQSQFTSLGVASSTASTANTNASTANANATTAINTAVGWITGFFNGITGQSTNPGDVSIADAQQQAASISETQAAQSAQIAQLQAQVDGSDFQGTFGTDTFDRDTTNGLGGASFWSETLLTADTGAYAYCDGRQIMMVDGPSTNAPHAYRYRCLRSDIAQTQTNYQKITITCGTVAYEVGNPASTDTPCWRIYFRMNAAETQYGFIEIGGLAKAQWGYRNGGSDTFVGSAFNCDVQSSGTNYTVVIGTTTGVRYYQLWRNNTFINQWNDSTNLVTTGPSNLGWGFGIRWGNKFAGQATPASIGSISVADNIPATIPGSSCRISRLATSNVSVVSATSPTTLPNNVFDNIDYKSNGMSANLSTGVITVDKAGTYLVEARWQLSTGLSNNNAMPLVFRNGTLYANGLRLYQGTFGGGLGTDNQSGVWLVQLEAGQSVRVGRTNSSSYNITSGGTSADTYLSVCRITP
ncbi:hypothetical protein A5721_22985 [Mycobacterium vulneris]|nr:hypothetical protein A5721_22985 [Mycolicibacterium vulneris]